MAHRCSALGSEEAFLMTAWCSCQGFAETARERTQRRHKNRIHISNRLQLQRSTTSLDPTERKSRVNFVHLETKRVFNIITLSAPGMLRFRAWIPTDPCWKAHIWIGFSWSDHERTNQRNLRRRGRELRARFFCVVFFSSLKRRVENVNKSFSLPSHHLIKCWQLYQ